VLSVLMGPKDFLDQSVLLDHQEHPVILALSATPEMSVREEASAHED